MTEILEDCPDPICDEGLNMVSGCLPFDEEPMYCPTCRGRGKIRRVVKND